MNLALRPAQARALTEIGADSCLLVAPTGFGKTAVALSLIRHADHAVVLFPTNILCDQFAQQCDRFLGPVAWRVGSMRDAQSPPAHKPIVCLTLHLYRYLRLGVHRQYSDSWARGVLVVDEVHKLAGVGNALSSALEQDRHQYRQVVGLTASPGGKTRQARLCKRLILDRVVTATIQSPYQKTITQIPVHWPESLERDLVRLSAKIVQRYYSVISILGPQIMRQKITVIQRRTKERLKLLTRVNPKLSYSYYRLYTALYHRYLHAHQSPSVAQAFAKSRKLELPALEYTDQANPKFRMMRQRFNPQGTNLVFFQNYTTLRAFETHLESHGVCPSHIAILAGKSKISQSQRTKTLAAIHRGEKPYLLSTSVAQQGVDLKSAHRVIFYEPVYSQIRFIQRAGRTGRHAQGHVDILYYVNSGEEQGFSRVLPSSSSLSSVIQLNTSGGDLDHE